MKRSSVSTLWGVSGAALLFLLAGDASGQKTAPLRGGCQSVSVRAPAFGKPAPRTRKPLTFSAAEILDLEFQVVVPADASPAALELKLFTPKGHLYQKLAVPSASPTSTSPPPKRKPRYRTITARLPVAGTTIVNNSLYGTWRVEAYFEGERVACAKPRAFVIKP